MTDSEIAALFDDWNRAIQSGDPKQVVVLYADDAVLLPTLSNRVRTTPGEIEDYFAFFLSRRPSGEIDESKVRRFGHVAINSGIYTFTFADGAVARARFTFVYRNGSGAGKIVEHHSSLMPEG